MKKTTHQIRFSRLERWDGDHSEVRIRVEFLNGESATAFSSCMMAGEVLPPKMRSAAVRAYGKEGAAKIERTAVNVRNGFPAPMLDVELKLRASKKTA